MTTDIVLVPENKHKNLSDTLREVLEICRTNIHSYEPSFHVINTYHEFGVMDLETCIEEFRQNMINYVEILSTRDFGNMEFDETNPGPCYYMNTFSISDCFGLLETRLLNETAKIYMNDLMLQMNDKIKDMFTEEPETPEIF